MEYAQVFISEKNNTNSKIEENSVKTIVYWVRFRDSREPNATYSFDGFDDFIEWKVKTNIKK